MAASTASCATVVSIFSEIGTVTVTDIRFSDFLYRPQRLTDAATLRKHALILPLQLLHSIRLKVNRLVRRDWTRDNVEAATITGVNERYRDTRHHPVVRLILATLGLSRFGDHHNSPHLKLAGDFPAHITRKTPATANKKARTIRALSKARMLIPIEQSAAARRTFLVVIAFFLNLKAQVGRNPSRVIPCQIAHAALLPPGGFQQLSRVGD